MGAILKFRLLNQSSENSSIKRWADLLSTLCDSVFTTVKNSVFIMKFVSVQFKKSVYFKKLVDLENIFEFVLQILI